MAKKVTTKAKRAAKRPAKKAEATPAAKTAPVGACRIMYRVGIVLRMWNPGEPVTQAMRDVLEKHLPPITASERMALEAKRRLHEELSGSIATAKTPSFLKEEPAPVEHRRRTAAELLGAPAATEIEGTADKDPQPVKAARERPQLI